MWKLDEIYGDEMSVEFWKFRVRKYDKFVDLMI